MRSLRTVVSLSSLVAVAACAGGSATGPRESASRASFDAYGDISEPGGGGLSPECDAARVNYEFLKASQTPLQEEGYAPGTSPADIAVGVARTRYQAKCSVNGGPIGYTDAANGGG